MKRIIMGGRCKGKMMVLEEFIKYLPEDVRKNIIIVKASDPVPKLRGNRLPRIVDYDMMESRGFSWELWDKMFPNLKDKRTIR